MISGGKINATYPQRVQYITKLKLLVWWIFVKNRLNILLSLLFGRFLPSSITIAYELFLKKSWYGALLLDT